MRAYKLLTADGAGLFSGFAWPLPDSAPGAWVAGAVDPCRGGIHACRLADLPYWLSPALYEIELDGTVHEHEIKVVAPRGRLIRRIDAWDPDSWEAYGRMCLARVEGLVASAPERVGGWAPPEGYVGLTESARLGFMVARVAEQVGGVAAYRAERAHQAEWLADRLELD
jgi:hypothetical protein